MNRTIRCVLYIVIAVLSVACSSGEKQQNLSLSAQLNDTAFSFMKEVMKKGTPAQSYYTLFIPENSVSPRHIVKFRRTLESALRRSDNETSFHYNASADRVFFLSKHKAADWKTPPGGARDAHVLAREFNNGTPAGWTILHAFWGQFNRLLVGNATWISNLPDSVRADLAHPLKYVLRVNVFLDSKLTVTSYRHTISYEFIEVGKERIVHSKSYPVTTSYELP